MSVQFKFDKDGTFLGAEIAEAKHMKAKPIAKWGHLRWCPGAKDPDKEEFGSYPEDGACPCGVHKHHVHCTCGGIVQVG